MATTAVILGSSFDRPELAGAALILEIVATRYGPVPLYRHPEAQAYALFRHGLPHAALPHQIHYRAHTEALLAVGCTALLVTSSVGVLDPGVPLFTPLVVSDLFMPENRLPDGSACTMFTGPDVGGQGHLVIGDGLFSPALGAELDRLAGKALPRVVFAYVGGPRTKTPAENRWLATTGAQVNSMTLGPEVVLANEREIPTTALVVGHKLSVPGRSVQGALDPAALQTSLVTARTAMERLVAAFLLGAAPAPFGNKIYRFKKGI